MNKSVTDSRSPCFTSLIFGEKEKSAKDIEDTGFLFLFSFRQKEEKVAYDFCGIKE